MHFSFSAMRSFICEEIVNVFALPLMTSEQQIIEMPWLGGRDNRREA